MSKNVNLSEKETAGEKLAEDTVLGGKKTPKNSEPPATGGEENHPEDAGEDTDGEVTVEELESKIGDLQGLLDQANQEVERLKKHSRTWENRAKKHLSKLRHQEPDSGEVTSLRAENMMFKDLVALEIESGAQINFGMLADSLAFREAYQGLDRDADDFAEKLKKLVELRSPKSPGPVAFKESATPASLNTGNDLYERIFGGKKK